ncbi:conserved hypothetical protein [Nitrospira sp. ND1]|jgi:uncharacterized protein YbcI|nr:conserved hypothetical protein [Nitrospira sp. ND1]
MGLVAGVVPDRLPTAVEGGWSLHMAVTIIGRALSRSTIQKDLLPVASKGEKEAAVRTAIIKFEQEFLGRGPDEVRVFIVRDMLVVRLKGVLTPAERQLAKTAEGIDMVKRLRQNLIAQGRERLCEQVMDLIGAKVTALFTDIDTVVGERIFVFTLESDIEANFR